MKLIQVTGYKKSGKTTLIREMITRLAAKGMKTGVIKHISHETEVSGNNDSALFLESGSEKVVIDDGRYLFEQKKDNGFSETLKMFDGMDYLFIEGRKDLLLPRIICLKGDPDEKSLDINTIARAEMTLDAEGNFAFDDALVDEIMKKTEGIKDYPPGFDCGRCGMSCMEVYMRSFQGEVTECKYAAAGGVTVSIEGKDLPMMPFVEKVLAGTVRGFLGQLKGYENGEIRIRISNDKKEEK